MASFSLNRFSSGDITYVNKFNSDNVNIETTINAIQANLGAGGTGGGTTGLDEIFDRDGIVGISSFRQALVSDGGLSFTSGSFWVLGQQLRARTVSAQTLNFVGNASGTYFINADKTATLTLSITSATTGLTLYRVYYSAPSFGSAERLVPILLAGDDYNRMLSSTVFGSFTRVADRLSAQEGALTLDAFYAQSGTSGTQWSYKAGQVRNNATIFSAVASFVSLPTSATFNVEVDPASGTVSYTSGGTFTSGNIPIRFLKTSGGVFVSNEDRRTWATAAFSGGGGTAGLTVSGTQNPFWTVATSIVSAASQVSFAGFRVNRGSNADDAQLRWNESADRWEFGTSTFQELLGPTT